jgi:hypothetical protein
VQEFGKKLDAGAGPDVISKLRDPVYAASYEAVETAVENNKPLLGSLYWKWAVPGLEKGECAGSSTSSLSTAWVLASAHVLWQLAGVHDLRSILQTVRVCADTSAPAAAVASPV